jgi:hypothetical protein
MTPSRKTRQRRSVRAEKKREPMVVEMVFPDPADEQAPDATANLTPPADSNGHNGSRPQPARIVFRFGDRS